jgi:hypothetical protein
VSNRSYAMAALFLWEEPRYQWVGNFDGSRAYLVTVQESRYIVLGFLTPLLGRGEYSALSVGRFIPLGRAPVPMGT